MNLIVEFYKP